MVKYGSLSLVFRSLIKKYQPRADTKHRKNDAIRDRLWCKGISLITGLIKDGSKVLEFGVGRGDLGNIAFDTALFAGVIEYVANMPKVIKWLSTSTNSIVLSHCCIAVDNGYIEKRLNLIEGIVADGKTLILSRTMKI